MSGSGGGHNHQGGGRPPPPPGGDAHRRYHHGHPPHVQPHQVHGPHQQSYHHQTGAGPVAGSSRQHSTASGAARQMVGAGGAPRQVPGAAGGPGHMNQPADGGKLHLSGARRMDGLRCIEVMREMEEGLILLTGGRDRRGGPLLTFPQSNRRERARPEDYKKLLDYLLGVPCDEVRELGFTVCIDMRGNSSWTHVKPILKVLQDYFANSVHTALIIKPDNFWQKQRTNLASQKYKFETNLIGLESLVKYVEPSQLTTDLDGTLSYDHAIWIEMRCALEDFVWESSELLDRLEDMREDLNHNDFADDVPGAKKVLELHNEAKKKIHKLPIESIDGMGQRLLQRLSTCEGGNSYDSGYSGRDSTASNMTLNPDLQVAIPQMMQLLDQVHSGQQQLLQLWQVKRVKLDQCLQLRMFEQDCEKMFDWIYSNREVFLTSYVDIGRNHAQAKKLQEEHNQFTIASNNVYVNISRILSAASKLIEAGHYAATHVRSVAGRLDSTWKSFAGGLDERTTVLALSTLFHQKAESYVEKVSSWSAGCEIQAVSSDIAVLESSIHHHQSLYEGMCQAYTEVHSTSKKLLYQLDHLVQLVNQAGQDSPHKKQQSSGYPPNTRKDTKPTPKSSDPQADYQEGASHVLSVIHEILGHHRQLEARWHQKKIKLHQRLALRLFQEDVKQVLDWLEKHGEVFLRKNVGIGKNLQKARVYQKSHETFEGVVQNTYTNAEKLLAAAEELAQTGECNAEDIYSVARELESHISSFAGRVEARRQILESAVLFYSHVDELGSWFTELKSELGSEQVADSVENAERLLEQFSAQRDSTLDALQATIQEGENLLGQLNKVHGLNQEMDSTGSVSSVQTTLTKLGSERDELGELWTTRKLRLDLCLQLRLFERDALELSSQFEVWGEELQTGPLPRSEVGEAERAARQLDDQISHIQSATFNVIQRGQDLLQLLESSGINLMADSQYNGETRVQVLLEYLQERAVDMEELANARRVKLEQCVSLANYQNDATQVMRWIQNTEAMLMASFSIPGSLQEAEQLKKEHEQFQVAIEKTHSNAVHVRQRAESLLQTNHFDPPGIKEIADNVTNRWQNLVTRAEERHKLVTASLNFYKTADQVCNVLDSLEREYRREDDWLNRHTSGDQDRATLIAQLINKHQEQKEAFLKACTLARRTAETFLKYSNRSFQYFNLNPANELLLRGPEAKVKAILEQLLTQENRVLEYWTNKKKRLDQNQQYVLFERSARQSLAWIKEEGDIYLSTHTHVGNSREETEQLLLEHNSFKENARETREKVKLLLQLADTLVEKGHAHAPNIKQWVEEVDETYKNFSIRMDQYREKLEETLGLSISADLSIDTDRNSDSSLEAKLQEDVGDLKQIKELNEERRRSSRRKEYIMAELLETERTYVKDLELSVKAFLTPMRTGEGGEVPAPLKGKEALIFGNLEDICNFHRNTFLKELEKYEIMPEDVGHCFVTWASKFDIYVRYCTNKPRSTELLVQHGGSYFEQLQKLAGLEQPIAAYLIKPVQRITKYQLLLKDLLSCCQEDEVGEIKEGLDVCLSVPRKANDALHLSLLDGCDISMERLGEVILQDTFQVWDPKKLIRQSRDRRLFLFELYLVFSKEVKDSSGKAKYLYKMKMLTSDIGITEHVEGDECKFAFWTGRTPASETKVILKAPTLEVKQLWVKKLRQLIQETYFGNSQVAASLPSLSVPTSTSSNRGSKSTLSQRSSRDFEDAGSLDESIENMERGSLASFGSGGTTDSGEVNRTDKVLGGETTVVISDYVSSSQGELTVRAGQSVEVLEMNQAGGDLALVRLTSGSGTDNEGLLPVSCLKMSTSTPSGMSSKHHHTNKPHHSNLEPDADGTGDTFNATSPINKRRPVFSGKWLPNIRKLSQGKLEKSQSIGGHDTKHIQKQISKSKFKFGQSSVDTVMGNKNSSAHQSEAETEAANSDERASNRLSGGNKRETEAASGHTGELEDVVEVPPPMRPISSASIPPPAHTHTSTAISDTQDICNGMAGLLENPGSSEANLDGSKDQSAAGDASEDVVKRSLEQRSYRVLELVESEKDYVVDLSHCVQYISYMRESKDQDNPEIPMPEDLREGKDRMIFGNLEMIYEWHRDFFSKNLEKCSDNPAELGALFKKCERKFQMYVVYCQNKPKSEFIVSEYIHTYFEEIRLKLGFKLRLSDLLIKPIQRLTKYHMLLEAILKHSQRAGLADEAKAVGVAFQVMTVVPNQANDMMDIGRLQGFEGKIVAQGKLLQRGPLMCTEDVHSGPNFKLREMTVFLFEQIMIFSETVGKKTQFTSPVYTYKSHIQVNKMQLDEKIEGDTESKMFKVRSTDPSRPNLVYICQAENQEQRDKWTGCIKRQLQTQLDFLKALQAPIAYHSKKSKDLKDSELAGSEWEVSTSGNKLRPRSNPYQSLDTSPSTHLSIEEAFDRAMSLPSSPLTKEPKSGGFEKLMIEEAPLGSRPGGGGSDRTTVAGLTRSVFGRAWGAGSSSSQDSKVSLVTEDQLVNKEMELAFPTRQTGTEMAGIIPVGSTATVHIDSRGGRTGELTVSKGEQVTVLANSISKGYLVEKLGGSSTSETRGWVPSYCLHLTSSTSSSPNKKTANAWGFRVRKTSFTREKMQQQQELRKAEVARLTAGAPIDESVGRLGAAPLHTVYLGETAVLRLTGQLARPTEAGGPTSTWHHAGAELTGERFHTSLSVSSDRNSGELTATLRIESCTDSDSGVYTCTVNQRGSSNKQVLGKVELKVLRQLSPPGQPRVQDLKGSQAVVTWDAGSSKPPPASGEAETGLSYKLEMCRLATGAWTTVRDGLTEHTCVVDSLVQGETFSFRVTARTISSEDPLTSMPSLPSPPLTVPLTDLVGGVSGSSVLVSRQKEANNSGNPNSHTDPVWQTDFESQYIELEEVGRGRFSVVRRCQEVASGREVAVKFVNMRKRSRDQTRREFDLLARVRHTNIVGAASLFTTSTSDAIVMDLICGEPLFAWLCESPSYSESSICGYLVQLLSALSYLHSASILHLDIKPENLLVEGDHRTLKLIDLGESQVGVSGRLSQSFVPNRSESTGLQDDSVSLEFVAPEQVAVPDTAEQQEQPDQQQQPPLGTYTDMWSVGVILYVLLSGMSPFLDDSLEETRNNILRCDFSFPESGGNQSASAQGRKLVENLLVLRPEDRLTASGCLSSSWVNTSPPNIISSRHLNNFNNRRRRRFSTSLALTPARPPRS